MAGPAGAGPRRPLDFVDYYGRGGEHDRLVNHPVGRLEYVRTRDILEPLLPATGLVLDVGGATGVHARWIASPRRPVHVVDLLPAHVEVAATLPGVTAEVGDARHLDRPDASAAAVLLMGPLYHLVSAADRAQALSEAARVVEPGGPVAVAAIARHASMLDLAAQGRLDADVLRRVSRTVLDGVHDPSLGFTDAYFHRVDELRSELVAAGLEDVSVLGVEGPGFVILRAVETLQHVSDELFDSALQLARAAATDPALIAAGSHLLATGRRPR